MSNLDFLIRPLDCDVSDLLRYRGWEHTNQIPCIRRPLAEGRIDLAVGVLAPDDVT